MDNTQDKIIESVENINKQIVKNEKENPTQEKPFLEEAEIFRILEGRGVEYKTDGGLIIYIKPLRIKQFRLLLKLLKHFSKLDEPEKTEDALNSIGDIFGSIFSVTIDDIESNCDIDDYKKIIGLLTTAANEGKDLYKKKELSVSFKR